MNSSFITPRLSVYKGDALDRGDYQDLKLTEQAMKIIKMIFKSHGTPRLAFYKKGALQMQSMGLAVEIEILGSEQVALYGLHGPRPCPSEGHRVGAEKARYCGMD